MKILSLKGILTLFIILFSFTSCERYVTECMTPTLGGEYTITRVEIHSVDQTTSPDTFFISGMCETPLPYPFDKFMINEKRVEINYSEIKIKENSLSNYYQIDTIYTLKNCTPYSVGFMDFSYKDPTNPNLIRRLIFNVDDSPYDTKIVLRHEGVWPQSKWGEKLIVSFFLSRD